MVLKLVRDIWWISFDAEAPIVNCMSTSAPAPLMRR
jgi:hypothetical protein